MKIIKKIVTCFLLMCLLTDCPLAVFADIWEMSYEEDKQEE